MGTARGVKTLCSGISLAIALVCSCALAGKPATPPPLPFPVKYRIQFVPYAANGRLYRLNNAGIASGGHANAGAVDGGTIYDSTYDIPFFNLRDLVQSSQKHLMPADWEVETREISPLGKVVGTITSPDGSVRRAYVLDTHNVLVPDTCSLTIYDASILPFATSSTRGRGVNDSGDVLGKYFEPATAEWKWFVWNSDAPERCHFLELPIAYESYPQRIPRINGRGQVVGQLLSGGSFRFTPDRTPALEIFPELENDIFESVSDLNENGAFCGRILYKPTKGPQDQYVYRCDDGPGSVPVPVPNLKKGGTIQMNASYDLILKEPYYELRGVKLYHEATKYLFVVEDLVDPSDLSDADYALWMSRTSFDVEDMTDRFPDAAANRVGRLCGTITVPASGTALALFRLSRYPNIPFRLNRLIVVYQDRPASASTK